MRLGIVAAGMAAALAVGACAPSGPVASAPDLTAVPGAVDPVAGASFGPASAADITSAIDALDGLASYRFIESRGVPPVQMQGVVVNGEPHRVRTDTMTGGAVGMSLIEIGSRSWVSIAGSAYQADDIGMGGPDDPVGVPVEDADTWVGPVAGEVASITSGLGPLADLGVELRNGLAVRHLRATATGEMTVDENGDPLGDGFEGVVETWIAVDGGYLAGVRAVGSYAGSASDDEASVAPEPYRLELTVEGADDSANRVDEPVTPEPTVLPSGDPAIVALLDGVDDGLARLDAYVARLTTGATGEDMAVTITVVNRPVAALLMETSSIAGMDAYSTLIIGDRAWSREGDGPWSADPEGGLGGMCQAGAGGSPAACAIDSVIGLDQLPDMAGAFEVADADEAVGGISTTHLHSSSGMPSVGVSIPGAMDVWIANSGGHLVKYAFDGQGIDVALELGRVNDPTIVVAPPADVSPVPVVSPLPAP